MFSDVQDHANPPTVVQKIRLCKVSARSRTIIKQCSRNNTKSMIHPLTNRSEKGADKKRRTIDNKSTFGSRRADFSALARCANVTVWGPMVPGAASRARSTDNKITKQRLVEDMTRRWAEGPANYIVFLSLFLYEI